jgi:hypothetical protein
MATYIPSEGEEVVDFDALESHQRLNTSVTADSADAASVPMRPVHGFERIAYLFANPYWIVALRKSMFVWFLSFFAATSLVSFLNVRHKRDV